MKSQEERTVKLEQQTLSNLERLQRLEQQVDMVHDKVRGLVDSCTEAGRTLAAECETRQRELDKLQLALKNCEATLTQTLHETARELRNSFDGLQRRSEDAGGRCKEFERQLSEEHLARQQEHRTLQASLASLQAGAREEADCRASQMREQQELRSALAAVQKQCSELVRDSSKEVSKLVQTKHQESLELVRDCGNRCRDLVRQAQENRDTWAREHSNLRSHFGELEQKCGEMIRDLAEDLNEKQLAVRTRATDVDKRCGLAVKDLACRVDDLEHNLLSHSHEFTSTKTYRCGLAVIGTSASLNAGLGGYPRPGERGLDEMSQASTIAGLSEPL